jgi:hypothetical protein
MKHIKMTALSKTNGKWFARLEHTCRVFPYISVTNNIIASGQLSSDGSVFTNNCSVVSDKPIDVELVKNAIYQQWRVFG